MKFSYSRFGMWNLISVWYALSSEHSQNWPNSIEFHILCGEFSSAISFGGYFLVFGMIMQKSALITSHKLLTKASKLEQLVCFFLFLLYFRCFQSHFSVSTQIPTEIHSTLMNFLKPFSFKYVILYSIRTILNCWENFYIFVFASSIDRNHSY